MGTETKNKILNKEEKKTAPTTPTPPQPATFKMPSSLDELFEEDPDPRRTAEQVAKDEKRQKRKEFFANLGDGIRQVANLVATTQGAPAVHYADPAGQTNAVKQGYEQLLEREEGKKNAWMQRRTQRLAMALDELHRQNAEARQKERDKIDDQRYDEGISHRNEREKIDDQRYDENIEHRDKVEQKEDERYKQKFAYQKSEDAKNRAQRERFHDDGNNAKPPHKARRPRTQYTGRDGKTYDVPQENFTDGNINKLYNSKNFPDKIRRRLRSIRNITPERKWQAIQEYLVSEEYDEKGKFADEVWNLMANKQPGHQVGAVKPSEFTL